MLLEGYQNQWEQEEDVGNSRKQGSPEGNQEAGHTALRSYRNSLARVLPQLPLLLLLLWGFWPSKFLNSSFHSLFRVPGRNTHQADWACVSSYPQLLGEACRKVWIPWWTQTLGSGLRQKWSIREERKLTERKPGELMKNHIWEYLNVWNDTIRSNYQSGRKETD